MIAVTYDDDMLDKLDHILAECGAALVNARDALNRRGEIAASQVDRLLQARDEMAMRLARYDMGMWIPDAALDVAFDIEDEASEILGSLGLDRPDYYGPTVRAVYRQTLDSLSGKKRA